MVEHIFFEGARGLGKSSIVAMLRKRHMGVVSFNHTGLSQDHPTTKDKMVTYYNALNQFITSMPENAFTAIHDRSFFSELVMSKIYKKTYTFDKETTMLLEQLNDTGKKSVIILLYNENEKELYRNLTSESRKDKALLFDNEEIKETTENTRTQQTIYRDVMRDSFKEKYDNVRYIEINTEGKSLEDIVEAVEKEILHVT